MENLENFVKGNYNRLLQTFLSERKIHNNIGALFINLDSEINNVYYLSIDVIQDEEIKKNIINRNKIDTNKALLFFFDKKNSQLVEIPLEDVK